MQTKPFRIGTRGSPLALAQAYETRSRLMAAHGLPEEMFEIVVLSTKGDRITDLAQRAGIAKQSMADLVDQCSAWGLVTRQPDPLDARARRVCFTPTGLAWLQAFREAVAQAEAEFRAEVGDDVAVVVAIGLEAYANGAAF